MSPARTAAMTIGSAIGNVLCFIAIASPARVEQGGALMKPEGPPIPVYERDDRVLWEHLLQLEPEIGSMDRIDAQRGPGNERDERRRRQAKPDAHDRRAFIKFGHRCWLRTTVYDQRRRGRSRLPKSSRRASSAAPARERPRAGQPKR